MPRLWESSIGLHRDAVRAAVLDAADVLLRSQGISAVSMSAVAEHAGIGRATLYKYFPDVNAVLEAWHQRQIRTHLAELRQAAAQARPDERLSVVLRTYADITRHRHGNDLADVLHRDPAVQKAKEELAAFLVGVIEDGAAQGQVRRDVEAREIATFCLHALSAAGSLRSAAAVRRLVALTLSALRAPG